MHDRKPSDSTTGPEPARAIDFRSGYIAGRRDAATPDWRDAVAAVREALDIPHPRTAGDAEVFHEILDQRLMQALVMMRSVLDRDNADVAWHVEHLRARLAEMP